MKLFFNKKMPCTWELFIDLCSCLWHYSYQWLRLFAVVLITLAYEGSSGSFSYIIKSPKSYIAVFLFLISFWLKKIIKIKSVSELEAELKSVKIDYFQDVLKRIKGEIWRKLEKEKPVDFSDYWHDLLAVIAKIYNFTNHERISIFAFTEDDEDQVIMLGRYSKNRFLNNKGRGYHSTKQGSIAKALQSPNDYSFKDNFPKDDSKYEQELIMREKMSKEDIKKLKMRAKTIGSFVLHNAKGIDQLAILVLESQDSKSKILTEEIALNIYNEFKNNIEEMIYFQKDLKLMPISGVDKSLENDNDI